MTSFVFVHGGSHGAWCWEKVIDLLKNDKRVRQAIAIDLAGHGARLNEKPLDAITLDDYIADIARAVRETKANDVVLVGHSLAGASVPQAAAQVAGQLKRVVLVSSLVPLNGETVWQTVRLKADSRPMEVRYREMFCNDMDEQTAAWVISKLTTEPPKPMQTPITRPPLPASLPRTYVMLLKDNTISLDRQEAHARTFGAEIVKVEAGHDVMVSNPKALAQVLLALA
jgi:pimeloyl-ACP methyl ester carboxylesterase